MLSRAVAVAVACALAPSGSGAAGGRALRYPDRRWLRSGRHRPRRAAARCRHSRRSHRRDGADTVARERDAGDQCHRPYGVAGIHRPARAPRAVAGIPAHGERAAAGRHAGVGRPRWRLAVAVGAVSRFCAHRHHRYQRGVSRGPQRCASRRAWHGRARRMRPSYRVCSSWWPRRWGRARSG